jgi:energy-coupling factor transporter transmembrane protein EcfT
MAIAAVQLLAGAPLYMVAGALAGAARLWSGTHLRRLLRRVRYIALAIVILFAWYTPGRVVLEAFPGLSPSVEGLALAADHLARLVAAVALVALLLGLRGSDYLVSGLYWVLRPLDLIGAARSRLATRLLLVLRYVEQTPEGGWRAWLSDPPAAGAEILHVASDAPRAVDYLLLLLGLSLLWWLS